jgi:hypothetical protein
VLLSLEPRRPGKRSHPKKKSQVENCVAKVGVYYPNQPSRTSPSFWIERSKAREEVMEGRATWIDSSRSIRLTRLDTNLRDESCRMGPKVIEDCWSGKRRARAIADGWRNPSQRRTTWITR